MSKKEKLLSEIKKLSKKSVALRYILINIKPIAGGWGIILMKTTSCGNLMCVVNFILLPKNQKMKLM